MLLHADSLFSHGATSNSRYTHLKSTHRWNDLTFIVLVRTPFCIIALYTRACFGFQWNRNIENMHTDNPFFVHKQCTQRKAAQLWRDSCENPGVVKITWDKGDGDRKELTFTAENFLSHYPPSMLFTRPSEYIPLPLIVSLIRSCGNHFHHPSHPFWRQKENIRKKRYRGKTYL